MNGATLRRALEPRQSLRSGAGFDYVQEWVGPGMFVRKSWNFEHITVFSLSLSWPFWHAYILLIFDLPRQTWGRGFKGLTFPWQRQCQSERRVPYPVRNETLEGSLIIPSSLNVVTTIGMGKGLSRLRCYRYFCHNLSHSLPAENSRCQRV